MVGADKGGVEFAKNHVKVFKSIIAIAEENVDLTVEAAIPNEVMVGWVVQRDLLEVERGVEMEEQVESGHIVRVRIGITTDEMGASG